MEGTRLLALDVPRVVVLHKNDHAFTYHLRRIATDDWKKYFEGIVHQTIERGDEQEKIFETDSALIALVTRTVEKVEGYKFEGFPDSLPSNWRDRLPLRHRLAVGIALRSVGESEKEEPQGEEIVAEPWTLGETAEISLDATWTSGENGKMEMHKGLIHRFRLPSIEIAKRFSCERSRVRVNGTAEYGVTNWPIIQAIAMNLYDDVIEAVEGYSVNGQPLTGVENIRREMDGAHKAAAALALFTREGSVSIFD